MKILEINSKIKLISHYHHSLMLVGLFLILPQFDPAQAVLAAKDEKTSGKIVRHVGHSNVFQENTVWVHSLKGKAFASKDNKTRFLKENEKLSENTEIITEVGSLVDLVDHSGRQYFLASAGQIKIGRNFLEVKRGYVWIKSESNSGVLKVESANGEMQFTSGESILSFDPRTGKTQILVIRGKVDFQNKLNKELSTEILAGQFSFIDDKMHNGVPRAGTAIGFDSFKRITSMFQEKVTIGQFYRSPKRELAMENEKSPLESASSQKWLQNFYQKQLIEFKAGPKKYIKAQNKDENTFTTLQKKDRGLKPKSGNVPVLVFGKKWSADQTYQVPKKSSSPLKLIPAQKFVKSPLKPRVNSVSLITHSQSSPSYAAQRRKIASESSSVDEIKSFESSLNKKYLEQKRHNSEVSHLIKELNTYSEDYKTSY